MSLSQLPVVGIFWDLENCALPKNVSAATVVKKTLNFSHSSGQVVLFNAYSNVTLSCSKGQKLSELRCSGVSLIHCPHNGQKDVVDKAMLVDMFAFAFNHPAPATIIVISGDGDFSYGVSTLTLRKYNVIVISPSSRIDHLLAQSSTKISWEDLIATDISASNISNAQVERMLSNDVQSKRYSCNEPNRDPESDVSGLSKVRKAQQVAKPDSMSRKRISDMELETSKPAKRAKKNGHVFDPLIRILINAGGKIKASQLAHALKMEPSFYQRAEPTKKFDQYIQEAQRAGVIIIEYPDNCKDPNNRVFRLKLSSSPLQLAQVNFSSSKTSNVPQTVPSFLPLIETIKELRDDTGCASRSLVAKKLIENPDMYREAGVTKYSTKTYLRKAAEANVVIFGSTEEGNNWIKLVAGDIQH